jgi:autotransporter family porin
MNQNYRLVWNVSQNAWTVASELAKRGKKSQSSRILAVASLVAMPFAFVAEAATCTGSPIGATAGVSCSLEGETIDAAADPSAHGDILIQSTGAGAVVNLTDVNASFSGTGVQLISTEGGGAVNISGGDYSASGVSAGLLFATGAGTQVSIDNATMVTSGTFAHDVLDFSGGAIGHVTNSVLESGTQAGIRTWLNSDVHVSDSKITAGWVGYSATNHGSITAENVAVYSGKFGVQSMGGSTVRIIGGSIETNGYEGVGLYSTDDSIIDLSDSSTTTIITHGESSGGASANGTGSIVLNGDSIRTYGDKSNGLGAASILLKAVNTNVRTFGKNSNGASVGANSSMSLEGVSIETGGEASHGLYSASYNASTNVLNSSISTTGEGSHGAVAYIPVQVPSSMLSTVKLENVDVSTSGNSSFGLHTTYGRMDVQGGSVHTQGIGSHGITTQGAGGVSLAGTHVTTEGAGAHGAFVDGSSTNLSVENGSIRTTGSGASGLWITNAIGAEATGALDFRNSTIISETATGLTVEGVRGLQLQDSSLMGSLGAVEVKSGGEISLAATNSSLDGGITTASGGVSHIDLQGDSLWNMQSSSNVSSLRNAASAIVFARPTSFDVGSFKTLTVAGDYTGKSGVIELNTQLGGDDSLTDKLIIQGNSEGDTTLLVNNAGGSGALTDEGIQVVEVQGSSNGTFTLGNRVVAGSYEYQLSMGGKTPDGNWYLRSELNEPVPEPQPEPEPEPVDPVDPVDPVVPGPKPTKPSLYRPEIGAYLGNQLAAISMFRHTLHERVGELDFSEAQRAEGGTPGSVWMRVKRNDFTADTGAKQIDVDTTTDILQVGADLVRWMDGDSRYHLGVMAGSGKAQTDVDSNVLGYKAKGEVEGYSVGVYGTWYQSATEPTGAYVDTWLQFGDYDNSVKGDGLAREKYDSKTWSASVEAGYAIEVGRGEGKAFYVEPQAQVIYTDFKADKHQEQNGTVVKSKTSSDVTTRLGARAYVRPTDKSGTKVQPFVEANWWHTDADNAMSFNDTTAKLDGAQNLYEVKVGAEVDVGQGWSAFGHLGKQMSSGDQQDVAGQLGVKYSW